MALATNLLQGQASEWALLKRHPSEKYFGVQVCGGYPDAMAHLAQLLDENIDTDFVDINCGCPIDIICERGAGSALLTRPRRLEQVVRATTGCISKPVIVKIRCAHRHAQAGWEVVRTCTCRVRTGMPGVAAHACMLAVM
eukprot:GHRQ01029564.1.p2 GENE.GHRQ01029564.1~~GHRQ01029564.1.p2  ORF type:complete len:140 (+),score=56.99 GHRQ01029564.1:304-723(+)